MTIEPLPRSAPADQDVAAAGVSAFLDAAAAAELELHSLMVVRHGHVVAEGWWSPYQPDGLQLLYSLSKSFSSTAIGLAQAEGLLAVTDPILSRLGDLAPPEPDAHLQALRICDVLAMATGHHDDTLARVDPGDPVRSLLALPAEEPPGTWFTYNNGATLLLSAVIKEVTGHRLLDYLGPRLLEPMGISRACWAGTGELDLGFSGLHLTTEAVAKLGLLYLQRGVWEGRPMLPEAWVAEATRSHVDNPREPELDWRQGYGYQFWQSRYGYRGDGAYGQFCLVLPEADAVVVTTGATDRMQALLDRVWRHLLPALTAGGDGGDQALAARLGALALPPVEGDRDRTAADWSRAARDLGSPRGADGPLGVLEVVEAPDGWSVRLTDGHDTVSVRCGYGEWLPTAVALPGGALLELAASAAWTGPSTLAAQLIFVRTPHRVEVTVDEAAGTTIRWHSAPLGRARLADLALAPDRTWTPSPDPATDLAPDPATT